MKTLYMFVGLPGSGKSSYRKKIGEVMVLSTDDIIETLAFSEGKTYNEAFKEKIGIAEQMMNQMIGFAQDQETVIWDQTNLSVKTRKNKLAKFPNHRKIAVYFDVNMDIINHRNKVREQFGRSIPFSILKAMSESIQTPTTEEGFDHVIVVNELGEEK